MTSKVRGLDMEWRRKQVLALASEGQSQQVIADTLRFNISTIERDVKYWKRTLGITDWLDERLPFEYRKALISYDAQMVELWNVVRTPNTDAQPLNETLSIGKGHWVLLTG